MMKYAFVLVLLLIGGIGSVYGLALVYRWNHDMIQSQVVTLGAKETGFALCSVQKSVPVCMRMPRS